MLGIIGSILGAIIAPLFSLLEKLGIYTAGKSAGRAQQRTADLEQAAKDRHTADAVRNEVAHLPDAAVDDRLRKWERH